MENGSKTNLPMQALWVGSLTDTYERTLEITRSLYVICSITAVSELTTSQLAGLRPGYPIIIELEVGDNSDLWIGASNGVVSKILNAATAPVVLCIGHHVSAEIVVDWVQAGVFSYVERSADLSHFQQAFRKVAFHSEEVYEQYLRYEKLLKLWRSITEREASVLEMLMEGLPNKKIANRLGVSQRTIEARRQKLYEKLESRSVVDVVRTIYELDSLENIFHRFDSAHPSTSERPPNASQFLRTMPMLHRNIPPSRLLDNGPEPQSSSTSNVS